jgi:hypothetical protein
MKMSYSKHTRLFVTTLQDFHQGHGVIQTGCLYKVAQDFVDRGTIEGLDTSCVSEMPLPPFDLDD